MQKNSELYDYTQTTQGLIYRAAYQAWMNALSDDEKAAMQQQDPIFAIKRGYAESPGWMMVQVQEFDPEPLTVALFRKRAVYSAPQLSQALLELLASEGYLDRRDDAYHLTQKGRDFLAMRQERFYAPLANFQPMPAADITRLVDLTGHIIAAASQAATPPGTWCLDHSRRRRPAGDMPPLAHMIQYGSDFNAFRDDAHMAAYGAHDIQGHVWEGFAMIASGKAQTVTDLVSQLGYRGFYTEDWQAVVDDLKERGWLIKVGDGYALTDAGQAVQAAVEQQTDAYFFAPFGTLSAAEFEEWLSLMQAINEACAAPAS